MKRSNGFFPTIEKRIQGFLSDEEGSIPRSKVLAVGSMLIVMGLLLSSCDPDHGSHSSHRSSSHGSHSSHSSSSHGSHSSHSSHGSHGSHSSHSSKA